MDETATRHALPGAQIRFGDITDPEDLRRHGFGDERFDAVVSCLASRTGAPRDAWRIDHDVHPHLLEGARRASASQFVLLSAICVQKPRLELQRAKLTFEAALIESELTHSIVRPTAYFKSLSGQVERVKAGRPFVVFGDGTGTACKPIAEVDLARFIADTLDDPALRNAILPIGGPGDALTPRAQAVLLFELLGRPVRRALLRDRVDVGLGRRERALRRGRDPLLR